MLTHTSEMPYCGKDWYTAGQSLGFSTCHGSVMLSHPGPIPGLSLHPAYNRHTIHTLESQEAPEQATSRLPEGLRRQAHTRAACCT